ncbi:MAG: ATP-binding protein [Deltaproteobacteria bacterium]|nr:ATP-binding protein [Deltaproteobacteria bacterium]
MNKEINSRLAAAIHGEFHEKNLSGLLTVVRKVELKRIAGRATAVIGVRRCGKTYLLFREIQKLKERAVPDESILYVNFEDDRLLPMGHKDLGAFLDGFYALFPENHDRETWLFLDEIQNVEGWPSVVRRYLDTKKTNIFLTGSSAKMLSTEIATSLRGRSFAHQAWPFDFQEYLRLIEREDLLGGTSPRVADHRRKCLGDYLVNGGFPEVIKAEPAIRRELLQHYVETIMTRDVIERHRIGAGTILKILVKQLLQHAGQSFSINPYFNHLKSLGLKVSKNTLHEYLAYLEDCFFVFTVPVYSESAKKVQNNPKKIYAVDTGLAVSYQFGFSENLGRLFENLVFLELKRRDLEVAYYRTESGREVDFVCTSKKNGKSFLVQACYDASDGETLKREAKALNEAEAETGFKGRLVTLSEFNVPDESEF